MMKRLDEVVFQENFQKYLNAAQSSKSLFSFIIRIGYIAINHEDWISVARVYKQGIETKCATFQIEVPDFSSWDKGHLRIGRIVAVDENADVIGWAALSPISSRAVYSGVAEISIYIDED